MSDASPNSLLPCFLASSHESGSRCYYYVLTTCLSLYPSPSTHSSWLGSNNTTLICSTSSFFVFCASSFSHSFYPVHSFHHSPSQSFATQTCRSLATFGTFKPPWLLPLLSHPYHRPSPHRRNMRCPAHLHDHVHIVQATVTLEAAVIITVRALSSGSTHVNKATMTPKSRSRLNSRPRVH